MLKKLSLLLCLSVFACTGDDASYKAITGFEADKYLGTWYEIARLDHSFERGLDKVNATYSLREDGGLKVVNRGFDSKKQKWNEGDTISIGIGQGYNSFSILQLAQATAILRRARDRHVRLRPADAHRPPWHDSPLRWVVHPHQKQHVQECARTDRSFFPFRLEPAPPEELPTPPLQN